MKKVIIKIIGRQGLEGDSDVIELLTEGEMLLEEGAITLVYNEGESQGMENTVTRLTATRDKVILKREGSLNSEMLIKRGQRNSCFYAVNGGSLTLGIYGERLENKLNENGGSLFMSYTIDANGQTVSKNEVNIEVKLCQ